MKLYCRELIGFTMYKLSFLFKVNHEHILSICFHNPSKKLFEQLSNWLLKKGYKFISARELEYLILSKKTTKKLVFISFDDGWKENLELVESFERLNIPVTIFIPIEPVIEGNYWWEYASQKAQKEITNVKGKESFKFLNEDIFMEKINMLKRHFKLKRSCITLEELSFLSNNKLITIGSHTVSHPILNKCSLERQQFELSESKITLNSWLKKPIDYIAYPNGDFDSKTINIAKDCNYKLAFSIQPAKINVKKANLYNIPRYAINDNNGGYYENVAKMLGIWQKFFH